MNRIAAILRAEQRRGTRYVLEATLCFGPRKGETYIVQGLDGPRMFESMDEALECAARLTIANAGTAQYRVLRSTEASR